MLLNRKGKLILIPAVILVALSVLFPQKAFLQEENIGLDAAIQGPFKFAAGAGNQTLQVSIQNNRLADTVDQAAIQLGLSHYLGSALGVTAVLRSEDEAITVETIKVLLGTIPSGGTVSQVPFWLEVGDEAASGLYNLYLDVTYQVLEEVTVGRRVSFNWEEKTETIELTIEVTEEPLAFDAVETSAVLRPGLNREFSLTFTNTGREVAEKATARISASSPLSLTDDTAYLGDLEPGGSALGIFGLKIAGDAIPKEYTIEAQVKYYDSKGEEILSEKFLVPVKVLPRAPFMEGILQSPLAGFLAGAGSTSLLFFLWFSVSSHKKRRTVER